MHHRHYSFNSIAVARQLRKRGIVKSDKRDVATLASTIGMIYKNSPEVAQTMECMIHAEEFAWMRSEQTVYFLEDADVAHNLQRGSYNLHNAGALYQGAESFVLMLPPKFTINGKEGSGLLVSILKHDERQQFLFDPFFRSMGLRPPQVSYDGEMGDFTLCVNYQESISGQVYMRCVLPSHILEHVMKLQTVAEFVDYLSEHNRFNFLFGVGLEKPEMEYQFELMRLIGGFLIYRHALPERVRAGLPTNTKGDEATNPIFKKPTMLTVRSPKREGSAPQGHYRAWHFRQLMADRYYQGEHAAKAKGSRIVFVSDSFVGGQVDAHTVEM